MRKKSFSQAKIGVFFIVAVISFAAIGASVAHWEETLTISGVMTTDDIDPYFYSALSNDDPDSSLDFQLDPDECGYYGPMGWEGERRDKNVGSCDVSYDDYNLNIDIKDAYPCYYAHPNFQIRNRGSAPVLVHAIQLLKVSYGGDDIPVGPIDIMPGQVWGVNIWTNTDGKLRANVHQDVDNKNDHFSFMLTGDDLIINKQLDPESWRQEGTIADHMENPSEYTDMLFGDLCIHFENGCEQSVEYDLEIGINFYNWPEYVDVTPQQIPNTIASSTMIFKGELTYYYEGPEDKVSGTIAMVDEEAEGLGDEVSGFDLYAKNGAKATYKSGGSYVCGPVAIHDAYNTGGGWGSYYDPDCADWYNYQLKLDGDNWYVEYNNNVGNDGVLTGATCAPMSGGLDWSNMYATETGVGEYYSGMGTAESPGYALDNPCTGVNDGTQSWDMDWSWGSEYIPLQFPGFDVQVEPITSWPNPGETGEFLVTLTPVHT